MPKFWENLTPTQRRLLMFGVPLVAVAALVSIARGRPEEDEEAEADPMAPPETSGPTSGTIAGGTRDTGAIGTGSLSSFLDGVSQYLDNQAEQNRASIAELRSSNDQWNQELVDQISALDRDRDTPGSPGSVPAPDFDPTPVAPPRSPGQMTLINTETGRVAFTGPSGEGGLAGATAKDREKYPGLVSWKMPDGRVAWYVPGKNVQEGNVGALQEFSR